MKFHYFALSSLLLVFSGLTQALQIPSDEPSKENVTHFEHNLINRFEWGKDSPQRWSIEARLKAHKVPGVALAIIEQHKIIYAKGYGKRSATNDLPVNADTLFSVGSVSKMANAMLLLKLVDEGKLSLNEDVNQYLRSWQIPSSRHTKAQPVTLRHILSHTAGFNIHGFPDFLPGEKLPDVLDTLNGRSPAKHRAVRVRFTPGTDMDYSGGGITVSQLVASDNLNMQYALLADNLLFKPLSMKRSTFENPLPEDLNNVAFAHDDEGDPVALPRGYEAMPEMAASGLWTSAADLALLVVAILESHQTKNGFLSQPLAQDMLSREHNSWYGLGPRINGRGDSFVFHHGGANNSYRAWMEGHPETGNGLVILTNGTNGHFVYQEIRKAIADTRRWPVSLDGGFEEPNL